MLELVELSWVLELEHRIEIVGTYSAGKNTFSCVRQVFSVICVKCSLQQVSLHCISQTWSPVKRVKMSHG